MKPNKEQLSETLRKQGRQGAALLYGKSPRTIRRWMQEYDLTRFDGKGAGKLDYAAAKRIRALYADEKCTQKELADMFDISQSMVCRIVNNQAYSSDVTFGGSAICHIQIQQSVCLPEVQE
jgi:transposase